MIWTLSSYANFRMQISMRQKNMQNLPKFHISFNVFWKEHSWHNKRGMRTIISSMPSYRTFIPRNNICLFSMMRHYLEVMRRFLFNSLGLFFCCKSFLSDISTTVGSISSIYWYVSRLVSRIPFQLNKMTLTLLEVKCLFLHFFPSFSKPKKDRQSHFSQNDSFEISAKTGFNWCDLPCKVKVTGRFKVEKKYFLYFFFT